MTTLLRPILRKKKSVTFHPSTKPSSSGPNSPTTTDTGTWTAPTPPTAVSPSTAARRRSPRGRTSHSPSPVPPDPPKPFSSHHKLLDYAHLPAWQRDNPLILSSYRPASGSHLSSLPSLFALHNETCNVWSHLLGLFSFLLFGLVLLSDLPGWYPGATDGDWWALVSFFGGVCFCLAASASYHLFSNVGPSEARLWNGVDYAGIVGCIWGSFVCALHFGFPDDEGVTDANDGTEGKRYVTFGMGGEVVDVGRRRRRGYETMISVLAVLCTIVSITPKFRTPAWRPFRATMFVLMGLSAVLPVLHGMTLFGVDRLRAQMGIDWVALQGVLYVTGAGLYAARVPERFAPGRFDVFGASHQIFHVLVVLAAGSHLIGMMKALEYACARR